jgi:lipopolysaccharide cholinephosphotransferase
MIKLTEKIFSITDYNETHKQITILGLKIKFPKAEYIKLQQNKDFYYYKKAKIDITQIPPAKGQIRDIQLANLALLKELDYVCKESGLKYWLVFGSLLGAVRHKGFIPWDDDIDVGMMRKDYEQIINSFNKYSRNTDIYAEYVYQGKSQTIIKVKHKKCPFLFVDIFPHDYANSIDTKENRILKTKKLIELRKRLNKDKSIDNVEKVLGRVKKLNSEIIPDTYIEQSDIQCGLEYSYTEPIWVHSYDTIFPLKEILFEDFNAMCMNKPEQYLSDIYGNYMEYPKKFGFGHSMYMTLSEENKQHIKEITKG